MKSVFVFLVLAAPMAFSSDVRKCWVVDEADAKKHNVPAKICIDSLDAYVNGQMVVVQGNPFSQSFKGDVKKTEAGVEATFEPFSRNVGSVCSFETQTSIEVSFKQEQVGQTWGNVSDVKVKGVKKDRSDCHVPFDVTSFEYTLE